MDNYAIADQFSLLAKLMDIHGENAFKAKSYASASFAIEKLPQELAAVPKEKIVGIKGIGESVGKKVIELLETGELTVLQDLIAATPDGILEMMNIKGLGPKKINLLWKELGIDTVDALQEACMENKIAATKGFGEKTQQNILEAINFQQQNKGKYLYAQVEAFVTALQEKLESAFEGELLSITGSFRRQLEIIDELEWITTIPKDKLKAFFNEEAYSLTAEAESTLEVVANNIVTMRFFITSQQTFFKELFLTSSSDAFREAIQKEPDWLNLPAPASEEALCTALGMDYIPPFLREKPTVIDLAKAKTLPHTIQTADIVGLIHSHSNWSDGAHSLEEMARELIHQGFEYMVISDHSKAAFYANGLNEQRIKEQHRHIEELNQKLAPFKIYKSIECDILSDGEMDYTNEILASFDLVIASIHSNLQMTEEKAMKRLLGAITNPYVTILGHMTGRLLAKRKGYPVDYKTIIDACAAHKVVIEINAHPVRLDMDWRWIDYAIEKDVMLSVNPDAHTFDDFGNIKYGVLVAQKGGLTKAHNLSSMKKANFEAYLQATKKAKGII